MLEFRLIPQFRNNCVIQGKKEIDLALFYFKKIDPELIKKNYPENLEMIKKFSQISSRNYKNTE